MMERKPSVSDEDWRQYFCTMDAITTRKPERMKPNGMDMLRMKVVQIRDAELRDDAWAEYGELAMRVEEEA